MNSAIRVSILVSLLVCAGSVVHASDAPFIIAQLPGQLPGQRLPGQLPGPSSAPAKPATAPLPSAGSALPTSPCCEITAINKTTGILTAREKSGRRTIEIRATPAQLQNLRVGQDIFANLETKQASLDGKTLCCALTFAAAAPSLAAPATTLSAAPPPTKAQAPAKSASVDANKSASPSTVPAQQQLPGKAPASAPQLPGPTPAPAPSTPPAKTAGGLLGVPATGMTSPTPTPPGLARVTKPDTHCVSATMTSALFLKIDKIPGDSLDKCHHGEIELMSFTNSGNAITVTKRIDISTPRLFSAALGGLVMPEAILTVLESGAQKRILWYTMKNAVVNSVDQVAGSDDRETVQFRFGSLMTETGTSTATAGSLSPRSIAVSFALGQVQSTVSSLKSGVSTGRFGDFVVVKPLDASSPKLMQAKQSGQAIAEIVITLKSDNDLFVYKLRNVLVASDIQQGSGSGQSETMHLKPSQVMIEYNSPSRPGAPVKEGYDIKAGKKV